MKKLEYLLVPMIMIGILILCGCEKPGAPLPLRHQGFGFGPTAAPTSSPTLGTSFKQAEIPAGKAAVYIYRAAGSGVGSAAMPFGIKTNGKDAITLAQGGYYEYVIEPGKAEFTTFEVGFMAPSSQFSVTVDAKSGQAYYLKGTHGKGAMGRAHLEPVSPEVGAGEIVNCKVITNQ